MPSFPYLYLSHRSPRALLLALLLGAPHAFGETPIRVDPAPGNWLTRPYRARRVPPINLANSGRLASLVRGGRLYLSARDAVALAIENNIDVEVQRYAPLLAREVLRRAKAGGLLRGVGLGIAPGPQSVSLQGVNVLDTGSVSTAGNGVSTGGGIITQLGPSIPSFDPSFLVFANFQHITVPQSNTVLTGTTALVQSMRTVQSQYSQNWDFGLNAQLSYSSAYTRVNSQLFSLNPFTSGSLDLQLTQNLLQGFGSAVNGRNIRVQNNNLKVTDLQFRQQLITTVSAVLNLYWDLVSFNQDVESRRQAVATAQQTLDDSKRQVELGALAEIEITRARSQLFAAREDYVIAETNLLQQETILKNALSRSGIEAADLADVHITVLDRITIPKEDNLKPLPDLVEEALHNRVEMRQNRINIESNKLNLVGIRNALKPSLQAFVEVTNNGLTGDLTALGALQPGIAYLAGGYGNLLAQIARRNYPNYSAGFSLNIPIRNRAAQSDYVTSLLELRQNELSLQKSANQVRVDVQNAVIALRQARARYDAAVQSRLLAEESLKGDQRRFVLGATTPLQVVQDQRDVAAAQSAEVQAMANYTHARITLDQVLGRTLEVNGISVEEAMAGSLAAPAKPGATKTDQGGNR
ncbi:MAG: hypothetical protein IANPNBLG_01765 [Bryobacteraceae bacterium]|nr:hypothetical protein [Bryobacteraceae bacterium]